MTILEKIGSLTELDRAILGASQKAFEKKGYYETNIEEIALALSIGKGTIYRHFGNKLMLFLSIILNILEDTKKYLEKIDSMDSFEGKLDFFIEKLVNMTRISGNFISTFFEEHLYLIKKAYHDKNIKEPYKYFLKAREYFVNSLKNIIDQGKKEGKILEEVEPVMSAQLTIMMIFNYIKDYDAGLNQTKAAMPIEDLKHYIYRAIGYNGIGGIQ